MPKLRTVTLSAAQRRELVAVRDAHPTPYLRERAAALLKIADGARPAHVARHGLLKPRAPDTIYAWLNRYTAEGLPGLFLRPGRGRKPACSPSPSRCPRGPDSAAPSPRP